MYNIELYLFLIRFFSYSCILLIVWFVKSINVFNINSCYMLCCCSYNKPINVYTTHLRKKKKKEKKQEKEEAAEETIEFQTHKTKTSSQLNRNGINRSLLTANQMLKM